MNTIISITSIASVSPLGTEEENIWNKYITQKHCFTKQNLDKKNTWVATLETKAENDLIALRNENTMYKSLDRSVLMAILASRKAIKKAEWTTSSFGINIGSSRGATQLFENYYKNYLETGQTHTLTSPTTTLGNISTWVAHDLQSSGPEISHSITCSTALHSVLNGVAWLRAGMADAFLVGGSEAPLTAFTIAQMRSLKIYSNLETEFPNKALDFDKKQNTMILGEGAAVCCLEKGKKTNALAYIEGIGYATEILEHNISISNEATCFQKSMTMALQNTNLKDVDIIVMHAPGTIKGDLTEFNAIKKIFRNQIPLLTCNKWKIGHTFGASGLLSLEMALLMLKHNKFIKNPFFEQKKLDKKINKILINAVGFGGNAVSLLISL